jgi:hypothetical protein
MSEIISIGSICVVKHNINRFSAKKETNFFDWLICDFKTVLTILKDIDNRWFLTKDKFVCNDIWTASEYKVEHKEIKLVAPHDVFTKNDYECQLDGFISKYNRRLDRLKNYINGQSNLHMIYCLDHQFTSEPYIPTQDDVNNFYKYISEINPNNKCFLHIVVPPKYNGIDLTQLKSNKTSVYYLTSKYEVSSESSTSWCNENYNWEIIFDNIKKIDSIVTNDTSVQKQYSSLSQTRLRNIIRRNNSSNYNKHSNIKRYLNQGFNKNMVNRDNRQSSHLFNVNRNTTRRIQYYRLRNRTLKNRYFKNLIYT